MKRSTKKKLSDMELFRSKAAKATDSTMSKTLVKGYSIYDAAKKRYSPPYFFESDADAVRGFCMTAGDPKSLMSKFPDDYAFYFVGDFDFTQGYFTLESQALAPRFITSLREQNDKIQSAHRVTPDRPTANSKEGN